MKRLITHRFDHFFTSKFQIMRNQILGFFALLFFFAFTANPIIAQENEPTYFVVDYMKVKAGMESDYVKLEQLWKKIHTARIEAGQLDSWILQEILSPYGTHTEYNYITVNRYIGNAKLAGHFDGPMVENIEEILTPEELKLVEKTNKIRKHVKAEVWQFRNGAFDEDWTKAKIFVYNYFKFKPGKVGPDHGKVENDIWKPLHQARIKNGDLEGWGLYSVEMPSGSLMPYNSGSLDLYSDMEQYLSGDSKNYWEEVHPGKDPQAMIKKTQETVDLLLTEVRRTIEMIGFE